MALSQIYHQVDDYWVLSLRSYTDMTGADYVKANIIRNQIIDLDKLGSITLLPQTQNNWDFYFKTEAELIKLKLILA
jgi:hypothetical protein